MEIGELVKRLEAEFEDAPEGTIKPGTNMRDIEGWGSMYSLIIIALADTEYGVIIKGEELKNIQTIQDLFDLIQRKKS